MDTRLPAEAVALAEAAQARFDRAGGVDLARRAEHYEDARAAAGQAFRDVGGDEVDVRADAEQLVAGAALCRSAGAVVLPWPVVPHLLRSGYARLTLVDPGDPRVNHGDLPGGWIGTDLDGAAYDLETGARTRGRLGPFLTRAKLGASRPAVDADDIARHLVLDAWWALGGLERSLTQLVRHLRDRHQFGAPLADLQSIRFTTADAAVALRGLEELAKFTAWRVGVAADDRFADAVALRLHAAETARTVLRTCHQLYGAMGFCDETDLSVVNRHLQPVLRLPHSPERLALRLIPAARDGVLSGVSR